MNYEISADQSGLSDLTNASVNISQPLPNAESTTLDQIAHSDSLQDSRIDDNLDSINSDVVPSINETTQLELDDQLKITHIVPGSTIKSKAVFYWKEGGGS